VISKGHVAREEYQSMGGVCYPDARSSFSGLGTSIWSSKYYGLKSICAECMDLNLRILRPLTY